MTTTRRIILGVIACATLPVAIGVGSADATPPRPITCGPAEQLAAADAYIAALGDRTKAADVPFSPDAVRYENGLQTGFSGEQMRRDLDLHLQYSVMTAPIVHERIVGVDGDPNLLRYTFTVPVVIGDAHIVNAPTDETFRIPTSTCVIKRIDATITIAPV